MKASDKKTPAAGYDFSGGVRGKYAKRHAEGSNVVLLEPDVQSYFPDSRAVNEALRLLVRGMRLASGGRSEGAAPAEASPAAVSPKA